MPVPDAPAQAQLRTLNPAGTRQMFKKAMSLGLVGMVWRPYDPAYPDNTVNWQPVGDVEPPFEEAYETVFGMTLSIPPNGKMDAELRRYIEELLDKRWKEQLNKLVSTGAYDLLKPIQEAVYIESPPGSDSSDPLYDHTMVGIKQQWLVIRHEA